MNDQKKTPNVAMTQLPTTARQMAMRGNMPKEIVSADATVPSTRQLDRTISRKLNSIDQAGHVPGINSLLD